MSKTKHDLEPTIPRPKNFYDIFESVEWLRTFLGKNDKKL